MPWAPRSRHSQGGGLGGTSVDAVAQRAGIAKGTIYLYFASWSDLLAALRSRYAEGMTHRAQSILERADPADPEAVTSAFDHLAADLLGYVQANRRLYHILFHEAPGHQEQAMEPLRRQVARLLSQAMDQGALTPADTDLLAPFILDGLHAALLPLAHQDQQPRVPVGLGEILRRLLSPVGPTTQTITAG
jgi:TetR/AcrR family transcriptional regulator, transcriptional repressor for nem operon